MSETNYKIISIATLFLFVYSVSGEICVRSDGNSGTCIKISECPSAITLREKGGKPKLCGFSTLEPKVCCEENVIDLNEPFPPGCMEDSGSRNLGFRIRRAGGGGGGIKSLAREFPYMAALGFDGEDNKIIWGCGGTLITTEHVLTAAHCLRSQNAFGIVDVKYVRLGDLNLNSNEDDAMPQSFEVTQKIRHPDYRPPSPYNDLAIIKLDKPCRITPYVKPACLNTKTELPSGEYSATGWGQLGYGEPLADHLQNMIISLYNHTECQKAYASISKRRLSKGIDEKTQVCAGAPKIDTCPGDSGGPLQLQYTKDNTVYGVTSFGVACVISQIPGVYIKVSSYIPWIKSIILP